MRKLSGNEAVLAQSKGENMLVGFYFMLNSESYSTMGWPAEIFSSVVGKSENEMLSGSVRREGRSFLFIVLMNCKRV